MGSLTTVIRSTARTSPGRGRTKNKIKIAARVLRSSCFFASATKTVCVCRGVRTVSPVWFATFGGLKCFYKAELPYTPGVLIPTSSKVGLPNTISKIRANFHHGVVLAKASPRAARPNRKKGMKNWASMMLTKKLPQKIGTRQSRQRGA